MRTISASSSSTLSRRSPWRLAGGVASSLAAVVLLGGCGAATDSPASDPGAGPAAAAEAEDAGQNGTGVDAPEAPSSSAGATDGSASSTTVAPEPEPAPVEPQSFSGTGSEVVMLDPLGEEEFYASITHDGSSNIALWSVDENGQDIDLLVNGIGNYEGDVPVNFGDEPAALRIEADGDWSIDLAPLPEAPRWDGKTPFEGTGDSIIIIVDGVADGLTPVTLTHDGESNFAIWAWGESYPDLIVNDIGPYDGTTLLPDGSLVLQVNAVGKWSISTN